ncbi:MAG: preprotein translocase subunit YajC [Eubacteriales bacterium]
MDLLVQLFTFAFIMAMFYFMLIRPENKRKKEAENLRNSIKEGDDITTIGGITGKVCAVKEKSIVFETGADRVRLEVRKWAISTRDIEEK